MGYELGVDLGTSFTAAAINRGGRVEMVSLGTRSLEIPSVAFFNSDGTVVVGEVAERRGANDPFRVAREFKRRLGDPAPILLAGTPFSAEGLMAALLQAVITDVTAREGEPPAHVTLTRPANWGPYKRELFDHVPVLADAGPASTTSEPEAAALQFASTSRVDPGAIVAVYDLGGGTFDAAVLRKTTEGFEGLGLPAGIEHLGGVDFDDAVYGYVQRTLGPALTDLDPNAPGVRSLVARLRRECTDAKESLSSEAAVAIPVLLPGVQTEIRLTRQEFEDLVRATLLTTIEALRRALRSAQTASADVTATVLAGGSSRIPLIAELIQGELHLPVAVGTHPKHAVALGAALGATIDNAWQSRLVVDERAAHDVARRAHDVATAEQLRVQEEPLEEATHQATDSHPTVGDEEAAGQREQAAARQREEDAARRREQEAARQREREAARQREQDVARRAAEAQRKAAAARVRELEGQLADVERAEDERRQRVTELAAERVASQAEFDRMEAQLAQRLADERARLEAIDDEQRQLDTEADRARQHSDGLRDELARARPQKVNEPPMATQLSSGDWVARADLPAEEARPDGPTSETEIEPYLPSRTDQSAPPETAGGSSVGRQEENELELHAAASRTWPAPPVSATDDNETSAATRLARSQLPAGQIADEKYGGAEAEPLTLVASPATVVFTKAFAGEPGTVRVSVTPSRGSLTRLEARADADFFKATVFGNDILVSLRASPGSHHGEIELLAVVAVDHGAITSPLVCRKVIVVDANVVEPQPRRGRRRRRH